MDDRHEEENMKEAYNVFDQNGDGFTSADELRSVSVSLGLKHGRTIEDCMKMMMNVDVDGDDMVNNKEFKQMIKGARFRALGLKKIKNCYILKGSNCIVPYLQCNSTFRLLQFP